MKANLHDKLPTKVRTDNELVLEKARDRDFAKNPTLLKMTNISDWGGGINC